MILLTILSELLVICSWNIYFKRCQINENDLNTYFEQLKVAVNGIPVSLIYYMDEYGEDLYVDSFRWWWLSQYHITKE